MQDLSIELPPDVAQSRLFNPDLAPVASARRVWTTYNFAALWISMAHCIPTYMLAGGLIAVRIFENWAAPIVLVMAAILLLWAVGTAGGLGPMLAQPSRFNSLGEFWKVFVPSLTGMIGFWATLSLNIPDFTRFGRSQKEQML